jgi:hypothetical protein|tara:strand:- start:122 stop:715 length:594 start_codon:yes stop_codon:yes gene_type:complete
MSFPKQNFTSSTDGSGNYASKSGAVLKIESILGENHIVEFRAFLTTFNQSINSTWNTEEVYGRNDPIATFQNTKRTISLAWDVPAGSLSEAEDNLERTALLTQMLYPAYDGNIISRPPLVKIKFANLIKNSSNDEGLLGWIDSLSINPVLDMGMFNVNGEFFPKVLSISFNFNVLHQHDLGVGNDNLQRAKTTKFPF